MRKNTARHWLHAGLDLLPLILIPVFMIYSHRHTMTNQTTVDIQYKYESNEVNSVDDLIKGNIYKYDNITLDISNNILFSLRLYKYQSLSNASYSFSNFDDLGFSLYFDDYINLTYDGDIYFDFCNSVGYVDVYFDNFKCTFTNLIFSFNDLPNNDFVNTYGLPSYTDYNEVVSVDVHDETSSVMNVFMDNFNGAIDKYFNMGNVFGMTNVYQWFNTNIFNGQAPTIIFSVWNIVLYEFVMDLIFLLYALFMWFIDVTKRLIEKPLDSIK